MESLARYGFIAVRPETMTIRDQVELFQRAEVIVAPHGAALGGIVFSPQAKMLVLYPERRPGEYFYTMARRLGVDHYGLIHDSHSDEDSVKDFVVDQGRMEAMLEGPMGLSKRAASAKAAVDATAPPSLSASGPSRNREYRRPRSAHR
jgi:capsular polysaccharide biosynthesis protein